MPPGTVEKLSDNVWTVIGPYKMNHLSLHTKRSHRKIYIQGGIALCWYGWTLISWFIGLFSIHCISISILVHLNNYAHILQFVCFVAVSSMGPSDAIWRCRSWSTLVHVMACCLTAPSHYLNQCWLIISKVLWHSSEDIIARKFKDTNQ